MNILAVRRNKAPSSCLSALGRQLTEQLYDPLAGGEMLVSRKIQSAVAPKGVRLPLYGITDQSRAQVRLEGALLLGFVVDCCSAQSRSWVDKAQFREVERHQ